MDASTAGRTASVDHAGPGAGRPPGPAGRKLIGSLIEVRRDRLRFVRNSVAEHGDLVAFRMGPRRLVLLAHPRHFRHVLQDRPERYEKGLGLREASPLLGDGLLTAESTHAAAGRERLAAAFRPGTIARHAEVMVEAAAGTAERWRGLDGTTLDVGREMVALTLEILGRTLLPGDLSARVDQVHHDLVVFTRWAMRKMTAIVPLPLGVPTPANRRAARALRRLEALAGELIAARATAGEAGGEPADVLAVLLDPGSGLTHRQVRDEILTFLLAGHDTTAATLSWAWFLLGTHPEVEARLHHELAEVLGGRPPRLDDLPRLVYARAVLEETLRLYPPVWMVPRRTVVADRIDGYAIPSGTDVLLSVYSLHRHPELWDDRERFAPERFLPPRHPPPGAFLPFGAGARACLGSRFGVTQALLVLATLAQGLALSPDPGRPPLPEASLTLRPGAGTWMTVRRRGAAR